MLCFDTIGRVRGDEIQNGACKQEAVQAADEGPKAPSAAEAREGGPWGRTWAIDAKGPRFLRPRALAPGELAATEAGV